MLLEGDERAVRAEPADAARRQEGGGDFVFVSVSLRLRRPGVM